MIIKTIKRPAWEEQMRFICQGVKLRVLNKKDSKDILSHRSDVFRPENIGSRQNGIIDPSMGKQLENL